MVLPPNSSREQQVIQSIIHIVGEDLVAFETSFRMRGDSFAGECTLQVSDDQAAKLKALFEGGYRLEGVCTILSS